MISFEFSRSRPQRTTGSQSGRCNSERCQLRNSLTEYNTLNSNHKPHVRIIVPITSQGFRDRVLAEEFTQTSCELSVSFLKSGPVSVESAVDETLAGPGLLAAAVDAEADGCDAIVIDCMLDPALDALREAVAIPVVGSGEANMKRASEGGRRFSIVTVLDRQERLFRGKARQYGLEPNLVSVRSIAVPVLDLNGDKALTLTRTVLQSRAAIADDGAQAIVFGCTGMLGLGGPVRDRLKAEGYEVPIFDPLPYALEVAAGCARDGIAHSKIDYPYPARKGFDGLSDWPSLAALLKAEESIQ